LDGSRSLDMCPHCLRFNCDPMCISRELSDKFERRIKKGVCPSCGNIAYEKYKIQTYEGL
jgi:hypothetical protein